MIYTTPLWKKETTYSLPSSNKLLHEALIQYLRVQLRFHNDAESEVKQRQGIETNRMEIITNPPLSILEVNYLITFS